MDWTLGIPRNLPGALGLAGVEALPDPSEHRRTRFRRTGEISRYAQLGTALSLVLQCGCALGGPRDGPGAFSDWVSLGAFRRFAVPNAATYPTHLHHRRVWDIVFARLVFNQPSLRDRFAAGQARAAPNMGSGPFSAGAYGGDHLRRWYAASDPCPGRSAADQSGPRSAEHPANDDLG